jgi:hypothetical protein
MYRTLSLLLLLVVLAACARSVEPEPNLPNDPDQPLFTSKDLSQAKLVKELERSTVKGQELELDLPETEISDEDYIVGGDFTTQSVIAGRANALEKT